MFSGIKESIEDAFGNTAESLANIGNKIGSIVESIRSGIASVEQKITDFKTGIETKITNFETSVENKIQSIIDSIMSIPQLIADKIKSVLEDLFVPDEESMNAKIQQIRDKFAFIYEFSDVGKRILNLMEYASGDVVPRFTVDLSDYMGSYSWGDAVIVIDFAWYAKYKPFVDNILAGMIWITWLWHMYKRIPELIHGNGMVAARSIDIGKEYSDDN